MYPGTYNGEIIGTRVPIITSFKLFCVLYTRDILIHGQGYNNSGEGNFDTGIILRSQGYFKRNILNPNLKSLLNQKITL